MHKQYKSQQLAAFPGLWPGGGFRTTQTLRAMDGVPLRTLMEASPKFTAIKPYKQSQGGRY